MTNEIEESQVNHYYNKELPYLRLKKTRRAENVVIEEFEVEARGETINEALVAIDDLMQLFKKRKV